MFDVGSALIELECSACGYFFEVQILDVSCQVKVTCRRCRSSFRLEEDGSASRTGDKIERALAQIWG